MSLKPNCYEVTYQVYEGDNRCGGMVIKSATIKDLHQVERFNNYHNRVRSVKPKYVKVWDTEIDWSMIKAAIIVHRGQEKKKKEKDEILRLEKELAAAKAKLQ